MNSPLSCSYRGFLPLAVSLCAIALLLLLPLGDLRAQVIRVAFHNGATTTHAMLPASTPTTQGTQVNTSIQTWNNIPRNSGTVSGVTYTGLGLAFSNFVLRQDGGTDSLARLEVKAANGSSFASNGWGTANKDYVMVEGSYLFATSTATTNQVIVTNIPASLRASGYTVTVYADITTARTMRYILNDGGASQTLTINETELRPGAEF
jgi:hypothetical protein